MPFINDYVGDVGEVVGFSVRPRNPKFFKRPRECAYVRATQEHILNAYSEMGIPEWEGKPAPVIRDVVKEEPKEEEKAPSNPTLRMVAGTLVGEDWQETMSWPEKRSLACKLTDEAVPNKSKAEEVIKNYLENN